MRTPTLINWRGKLESGHMDHPVHVSDWMPTFTNLLGISPPTDPKWDGFDIWPLISGEQETPEARDIYWNFKAGGGLCMRSGDWKLISTETEGPNKRKLELFNIKDDPFEQNDLSENLPDRRDELQSMIEQQFTKDYVDIRPDISNYTDRINAGLLTTKPNPR